MHLAKVCWIFWDTLRYMLYLLIAHVISTGIKTNHAFKGLSENFVFLLYLKV